MPTNYSDVINYPNDIRLEPQGEGHGGDWLSASCMAIAGTAQLGPSGDVDLLRFETGRLGVVGAMALWNTAGTFYVGFQAPSLSASKIWTLPSADGSPNQVLKTDGSGVLGWTTAAATSPGGSDTYIQFNDSSAFGGDSKLTWNKSTYVLGLTGSLAMKAGNEARFYDASHTGYVGFKAPTLSTSNQIWSLPAADGTAGYLLKTDGSGALGWVAPTSGGSPGGLDTYVQFNDGGSFGGSSHVTWDKTGNIFNILGFLHCQNIALPGIGGTAGEMNFYNAANTHFTALISGAVTSDIQFTLPIDYGTSGWFLKTDGAGVLSWAAGASITTGNLTESTSSVLTITSGTGAVVGSGTQLTVKKATAAQDGYLASSDFSTFAGKQNALTFGNLSELTSSILTIASGTGAVIGSGTTITVAKADTSHDGYLSSTDWTTFNGKQATITKGNLSELTSSILTIGSGTNAVLGSGTTITVAKADTSTSGYLSNTDWNTFNGKQASLSFGNLTELTSSILTIGSGTGAVVGSGTTIAVQKADTSHDGYLSHIDWTTFNNKGGAITTGNLTETGSSVLTIGSGTGAVVGSGTTLQVNLTSAKIFVGNGSNVAVGVSMSGDIAIDNTGATSIGSLKVATGMIQASAVTYAKIQNVSAAGKVLGRISAGAGVTEELGGSDVAVILGSDYGLVPAGTIVMYGGAAAPSGWVLCDGASLLRAGTYAALFAVISTTFGSADGTHFNVPDFRGVFPKGAGTTNRAAGKDASGNYYAATLGTYYQDMMAGHVHMGRANNGTSGTTYYSSSTSRNNTGGNLNIGNTDVPANDGTHGAPRTGYTTEPQSLGVNFIIKY